MLCTAGSSIALGYLRLVIVLFRTESLQPITILKYHD